LWFDIVSGIPCDEYRSNINESSLVNADKLELVLDRNVFTNKLNFCSNEFERLNCL
jgi:hypothetical protein